MSQPARGAGGGQPQAAGPPAPTGRATDGPHRPHTLGSLPFGSPPTASRFSSLAVMHTVHGTNQCSGSTDTNPYPPDPHVFGPAGSGSFYHQAKIVRITLIPTVL